MSKILYRVVWENLKTAERGEHKFKCYMGGWQEQFEHLYPADQGYIWLEAWNEDEKRLVDFQDPIYPADIEAQRQKDYERRMGIYDYDEEIQ